jgi:sulfotransferase family protein
MPDDSSHDEPDRDSHREWRYYARRLRRHPIVRALRWTSRGVRKLPSTLWCRTTQAHRELPSVVIAGVQKGGTTQLFSHLIKHPRLLPGSYKELDYFSQHAGRSVAWYRSQFPLQSRVAKVNGYVVEASPSYMCTTAAIPRMHAVLPDARIIAVLRDPVSRAFSGYQHSKTRRRDLRSFAQAVEEELRHPAWRPELGQMVRPDVANMRRYVERSYYALQIEFLLNCYPRDQVLILDSADLFANTSKTCQRVFEFVGVEPFEVQLEKVYNRGYYSEKIDPRVEARLRGHFRSYDELLVEIVGRRFSWMADGTRAAAA